jgi:hypothetical protein
MISLERETMTKIQQLVLDSLRPHHEGSVQDIDGQRWASVYLDNARPFGMSPRRFAGHLSALEKAGLYKSQGDNCFGDVRLADE